MTSTRSTSIGIVFIVSSSLLGISVYVVMQIGFSFVRPQSENKDLEGSPKSEPTKEEKVEIQLNSSRVDRLPSISNSSEELEKESEKEDEKKDETFSASQDSLEKGRRLRGIQRRLLEARYPHPYYDSCALWAPAILWITFCAISIIILGTLFDIERYYAISDELNEGVTSQCDGRDVGYENVWSLQLTRNFIEEESEGWQGYESVGKQFYGESYEDSVIYFLNIILSFSLVLVPWSPLWNFFEVCVKTWKYSSSNGGVIAGMGGEVMEVDFGNEAAKDNVEIV